MRTSTLTFAATLVAAAVTIGCDDGDGRHDRELTIEELPAEMATVMCGEAFECLGPLTDTLFQGADCERLLQAQMEDAVLPLWQEAVAAGTLTYDSGAADDCFDAIEGLGCAFYSNPDISACEELLHGEVAAGGDCTTDMECQGDMYCDFDEGCPGVCTARVADGEGCDDDDECDHGLACQSGRCRALAREGDACEGSTGTDCAIGLICLGGEDGAEGVCQQPDDVLTETEGERCDPEGGILCMDGLACVVDDLPSASFHCVEGSSSGGPCRYGVPDPCPSGEYCDADIMMGVVDGTCQTLPGAGEPCHSGLLINPCGSGLECIGGTCMARQRLGATCSTPNQCYSGHCPSGTCATPPCSG